MARPVDQSGLHIGDTVRYVGKQVKDRRGKVATISGRRDAYGFYLRYEDGRRGSAVPEMLELVRKGPRTAVGPAAGHDAIPRSGEHFEPGPLVKPSSIRTPSAAKPKHTKPRSKLSGILSGSAGVFFVAGELSRRGYVSTVTLRNARGTDILVSSADATKTLAIQVKTKQGGKPEWRLNESDETNVAANLFYVFVRLQGLELPQYSIVPSAEVAKYAKDEYRTWLATPGRGGRQHRDNAMRTFRDNTDQYRGCWEVLGLD